MATVESLDQARTPSSSDSAGASQTELGEKLNAAVAEKDALAAKLADAQKEKLGAVRLKAIYRSARDKAVADRAKLEAELAKTAKERDDLLARLADADKEKERQKTAAEEAKARLHDELGPIADAILKEMQAGGAFAGVSGGRIEVKLSDALLFDGDSAKLTDGGAVLLQRVGLALKALSPREIRLEAHNDSAPLKRGLLGGFRGLAGRCRRRRRRPRRARFARARAASSPRAWTAVGEAEVHALCSDGRGRLRARIAAPSSAVAEPPATP